MKMESKIGEMESQYFGKNKEHDKKLDRMDTKFKHELEELKSKLENVKEILSHLESTKKHVDEVNHNLLLQLDKEVTISKMLQIFMEYENTYIILTFNCLFHATCTFFALMNALLLIKAWFFLYHIHKNGKS